MDEKDYAVNPRTRFLQDRWYLIFKEGDSDSCEHDSVRHDRKTRR